MSERFKLLLVNVGIAAFVVTPALFIRNEVLRILAVIFLLLLSFPIADRLLRRFSKKKTGQ
jgi:hypothetical protein